MERMTLEVSEELLRAVASVLDIRQVFPDVSEIVQRALPHDRLTMTLHDGRRTLIAHAFSFPKASRPVQPYETRCVSD